MQTRLVEKFKVTPEGQEAEQILRSCVHCGFCTATCPTYQLLGDELDGPRGRIYLIKQVLEGQQVTRKTQVHLDRCLTCRACETTCPSGVRYGRLVDIGRHVVEAQVGRGVAEKVIRKLLRMVIPNTAVFASLLNLGRMVRPVLPPALKAKIPVRQAAGAWPQNSHARKMLVLDGCVQPVTAPNTNAAAARVLDRLCIELIRAPKAGCCGAVSAHLSAHEEALVAIRRNIDAWWSYIEQGAEAIVMTASGCGVMVKDYATLLAHDAAYAQKAARVSALTRDLGEVLGAEDLGGFAARGQGRKIAFHAPCTLQHGQQLAGTVEQILTTAGYQLTQIEDAHLCCGSAGTYSILQPQLSKQLLANKLQSLQAEQPELIATANIGCQMHMATRAQVPVRHWIELLDPHSPE
ncbi:MAG: glycolate oxidase subunit GlcF [Gammaproteobacteria bacterium]|nr:glycolate oxidase subunit GlcF [Gammaproteobacteria bacterium]